MKIRSLIFQPTILTLANLFCGFSSLLLASAGHFESAVWIIIIASVFDSLDGKVARASGRSSEFGLQIDSLADVSSFGVAPSFLVYQYYFKSLGTVGIFLSFLPLLFAAIRLARFNIMAKDERKTGGFLGLPSPMAALGIVSVVFLHAKTQWQFLQLVLIILVPIVCLLMISTIKYSGLPIFSWNSSRKNKIQLSFFIVSLLGFPIYPHYILTNFMVMYLFSGPFEILVTTLNPIALGPQDNEDLY